jgi:hypothetical protein
MQENGSLWFSVFFFSILSCCTKSGDQPKEMLNQNLSTRQIEKEKNLGILLHVGEPLGPIN